MSGNKTEQPTAKKRKDAAQKGQSFKSKELIIICLTLTGFGYIYNVVDLTQVTALWKNSIDNQFTLPLDDYVKAVSLTGLKILLPLLLICILGSALPTLLQTGFVIAMKALKINFSAFNPVNGVKKIFSLRTLKDAVKTTLYFCCFLVAGHMFWSENKQKVFSIISGSPQEILQIWGELFMSMVLYCVASTLVVMVLDALAEFLLHIKDLKMDKQEVKREYKEQEGNQDVKSKRKELHAELLSDQDKVNIENSKVVIANPTHIAVGIYLNLDVIAIPFISVLETNQRALAVRQWAEKVGVPVVENVALARRIFKTHKRYSFVSLEELDEVLKIMTWLEQVENAWVSEQQASVAGKIESKN